ncbi:MAG: hypothetical protein C5B59_02340 [Bacteroidetes bacterium]|nr:MAG: hypothetical protein C5B59_02340 [Bacteroidota bacterium]
MAQFPTVTADELRRMLSLNQKVNVVDIRPTEERSEWFIPGSIHFDAYERLKKHDPSALDLINLDKNVPIVTVCAGGKTSLIAAEILREKGYNASSLLNGMKGWSLSWNTAFRKFDGFEIWQVRRTGKGCLSYIISSNKEALIVDASLPVEVYADMINGENLKVKYVLDTHIHADHLSRSRELAKYFNAPFYLPKNKKVQFEYGQIVNGLEFKIGNTLLKSMATPGHTTESTSFYIENEVLFTGDTLFTNAIGRPDLKSNAEETRQKAHLLFQSLQFMLSFPDSVLVLPGHANKPIEFDNKMVMTTIGEAKENIHMLKQGENDFVNSVLNKIPPSPANFLTIIEKNIEGDYSGVNPLELEAGANRCAI